MDLCNGVDREKVTTGLECCQKTHCDKCPYVYDGLCNTNDCTADLASDVLDLLKEQDAVKPFYEEGEDFLNYFMKHTMGRCGHCKAPLPALDGMRSKFCWMCGRQVKWDDR